MKHYQPTLGAILLPFSKYQYTLLLYVKFLSSGDGKLYVEQLVVRPDSKLPVSSHQALLPQVAQSSRILPTSSTIIVHSSHN